MSCASSLCPKLSAVGPGPSRREARELARSHALPQHGPSEGAQERGLAGFGRLTAAGRGQRCATRGLGTAHAQHHQAYPFLQNLTHATPNCSLCQPLMWQIRHLADPPDFPCRPTNSGRPYNRKTIEFVRALKQEDVVTY